MHLYETVKDLDEIQQTALALFKGGIMNSVDWVNRVLGGEYMIRDYWCYQKRADPEPWALHLVKEFDRRHPSATVLDFTLYSDKFDDPTKSVSRVGLHYDTVDGYVNAILGDLVEVTEVWAEDREQLERFILEVLTD